MEPRRDDGDDDRGLDGCVDGGVAAMEPRRDDGDDDRPAAEDAPLAHAAMEPRRDDGDDDVSTFVAGTHYPPQWSPVVTTGTTTPTAA